MRSIIFFISVFLLMGTQAQSVSSLSQDFGKVKLWNNPVFEVAYTNTSGRTQLFLPIRYKEDFKVSFEKSKLAPGESTTISIQYFTEEFGRFNNTVNVFISTQDKPITFQLKGNIQSFHPDAYTICPRIDNSGLQVNNGFLHTVRVIDQDTKEPLGDFELTIRTRSSREQLMNEKSFITLKREKPDFYQFEVDKEGYEVSRLDAYVNRNSKETIIELKQEEKTSNEKEEEFFDFAERTVTDDESSVNEDIEDENIEDKESEDENDEEAEPISDDEEYFDFSRVNEDEKEVETKVDEELIEEEVVVILEPKDTADFKLDGTLNESVYAYNHLVFLIDVSSSMRKPENLPLLKKSMLEMISVLRPQDQVSIITYSYEAVVLLSNVSGAQKDVLNLTINQLEAKGGSNGQEGVNMAYELAKKHFIDDGNNEIILASDGIFNSKKFNEKKIFRQAKLQRSIYKVRLSTIGFGTAKKPLLFLENLAANGDGSFIKIATENEAKTILIENMMRHSHK